MESDVSDRRAANQNTADTTRATLITSDNTFKMLGNVAGLMGATGQTVTISECVQRRCTTTYCNA
jgi:hypothetical protein